MKSRLSLGAAKTLFEKNLVGINEPDKQNLLGHGFSTHPEVRDRIKSLFVAAGESLSFPATNDIRNHAYHVRYTLRDIGVVEALC